MSEKIPTPFQANYTPNLPEILTKMDCSIAISTYQAGKIVFLSAASEERLVQLPRQFRRPMALELKGNRLAISTLDSVITFVNDSRLASNYPNQKDTYDSIFAPRVTYYTGRLDIHGIHWINESIWFVNTSFSCISQISDYYSFEPVWKPPFITDLTPMDKCHLNSIAFNDEGPLYASCLGKGDEKESWRDTLPKGGVLLHIPTNEIILHSLAMPHSLQIYDNELYMLLSANGELIKVNPEKADYDVVRRFDGFVRGMAIFKDHAFVACSKLRKNSSTFRALPIADRANTAGIVIIHLPSSAVVAQLNYESSVDEIYDIIILPGQKRPGIINTDGDTYKLALTLPQTTYWASPA